VVTGGPAAAADASSPTSAAAPLSEEEAAAAKAAEKAAKRERIRTKVAFEIESTEQSFVESLEALVRLYLQPLQTAADSDDPILDKDEVSALFSNIHSICTLNKKFLSDFSARLQGWDNNATCIGDIFVSFAPIFKMYTQYVGNHDAASELLKKHERDNRRFRELLETNLTRPENRNLSLASYFIMPIQRIPRYKLLIEELLRNTDDNHPDYASLLKGLDAVSAVARHINAEMHAQENRAAIVRIQNEFSHQVSFVQPHRRFIKQGTMTKKCRNSDKVYEFFLFNDCQSMESNNHSERTADSRIICSTAASASLCLFFFFCISSWFSVGVRLPLRVVQRHQVQVAQGDPCGRRLQHRRRAERDHNGTRFIFFFFRWTAWRSTGSGWSR
jgi:hypothetical protein